MHQTVVGCGIDIEEPVRFQKHIPTLSDVPEFIHLVYSDAEIAANRLIQPHLTFPLAFSCKEAFFKAFGVSWLNSPITWKDIELIFLDAGNLRQYEVRLNGYALELYNRMNCRKFDTKLDYNDVFVMFEVILFSS